MRRLLLLLFLCGAAPAIEVTATVVRIADGDTLSVEAVAGLPLDAKRGKAGDVYIRLLCVDTQEIWDPKIAKTAAGLAARDLLAAFAKPGSSVVLWDEGAKLTTDKYGRVLAFVRVGKTTAQEELVAAGLSAYWRRWRVAPKELDERLQLAEAAARSETRGAWASEPELMVRKSSERPK